MSLKAYAAAMAICMLPLSTFAADLPQKQSPAKVPAMVQASSTGIGYYLEGQLGVTSVRDLDTATYSGGLTPSSDPVVMLV